MSIVDLTKARAYADVVAESEAEAADWIRELADEVESLQRAVELSRRQYVEMKELASKLEDERDQLRAGLRALYDSIVTMLSDIGRRAS